jgi:outer membrane protein assembly factor BamB
VVGDRIYIAGTKDNDEVLFALDAKTGKELWATPIGPIYKNAWGGGPRATPVVDGDRVYALGGTGEFVCCDTAKGGAVWRKSMTKNLGGAINPIIAGPGGWGWSWSPLVDGDAVVCVPGGKQGLLAALDKKTGNVLWQSKDVPDDCTYSSPLVAEIGGVRQYVEMTNAGVVGVEAKTGNLLWYYKRPKPYKDVVIPTPLVSKDQVYTTVTSLGFGAGCDLVQVAGGPKGFTAKMAWANATLTNTQGGVVLIGDHVYGYSEDRDAGWVCQEWATGKIVWNNDQALGPGSVIAADGHLYILEEEEGIVALVEANTKEWKETGRFTLPQLSKKRAAKGKIWTHPVISNEKLYLRDQELLFCYGI